MAVGLVVRIIGSVSSVASGGTIASRRAFRQLFAFPLAALPKTFRGQTAQCSAWGVVASALGARSPNSRLTAKQTGSVSCCGLYGVFQKAL
jgi:hypothetical protein